MSHSVLTDGDFEVSPHTLDLDAPVLETVHTTFGMHPSDLAAVAKLGYRAVCPAGRRPNPHGRAAFERLVAEQKMLSLAAADYRGDTPIQLLDVGSNLTRVVASARSLGLQRRITIRGCMPQVVPNDLFRRRAAALEHLPFCTCMFEDCTHTQGVDHFISTHSVYYISPAVVASALYEREGSTWFSVAHAFPDVAGALCGGQLRYHVRRDSNIESTATGEPIPYVHAVPHWLTDGPSAFNTPAGPLSLSTVRLFTIGDTHVYATNLVDGAAYGGPAPLPMRDHTWDEAISSSPVNFGAFTSFSNAVNRAVVDPSYASHAIPMTGALIYGGTILAVTQQGMIPVPRHLLGALSLFAAGQPRDPQLYASLVARGRRLVSNLNMPDDLAADAVIIASAAALAHNIEIETLALGRVNYFYRDAFARHAAALRFAPLTTLLEGPWLEGGMFFGAALLAWVANRPRTGHHYLNMSVSQVTAPRLQFAALLTGAALLTARRLAYRITRHQAPEASAWAHRRTHDGVAIPTLTILPYPPGARPRFPGQFQPKTRADLPLAPGAAILVGSDVAARYDRAAASAGMALVGIGFSDAVPTYNYKSVESAVAGLTSRVLRAHTDVPDPAVWPDLAGRIYDPHSVLSLFASPVELDRHAWFRWWSRHPPHMRERHTAARASLASSPLTQADCRSSSIVKREKDALMGIMGAAPSDPRIVSALGPRVHAAVGPWHYAHSAVLKDRFSDASPIVWAIGYPPDWLGAWYDRAVAHFSRPDRPARRCSGDRVRYDANQGNEAIAFENATLAAASAPRVIIDANSWCCTPRGGVQGLPIRYRSPKMTRLSGADNTSKGNFSTNLGAVVYAFGEPGDNSYWGLILGDDFLLVGFDEHFSTLPDIDAAHSRLGLPTTMDWSNDDQGVEFISMLPYPTAAGTVFGPKIGRNLHRFGWSTNPDTADPIGAAISLANNVAHIPFLRVFVDLHARIGKPRGTYKTPEWASPNRYLPSPETYAFVQTRYGLTRADEEAFELLLSSVTSLPVILSWPLIYDIAKLD